MRRAWSRYAWPGNVRELENVIERAVALETTRPVLPERLPGAACARRAGRAPRRRRSSARVRPDGT